MKPLVVLISLLCYSFAPSLAEEIGDFAPLAVGNAWDYKESNHQPYCCGPGTIAAIGWRGEVRIEITSKSQIGNTTVFKARFQDSLEVPDTLIGFTFSILDPNRDSLLIRIDDSLPGGVGAVAIARQEAGFLPTIFHRHHYPDSLVQTYPDGSQLVFCKDRGESPPFLPVYEKDVGFTFHQSMEGYYDYSLISFNGNPFPNALFPIRSGSAKRNREMRGQKPFIFPFAGAYWDLTGKRGTFKP